MQVGQLFAIAIVTLATGRWGLLAKRTDNWRGKVAAVAWFVMAGQRRGAL